MALLKIKVNAKIDIVWGNANVAFIREINASKDFSITYNNATGQSFTAGQVLYSEGVSGQPGYLRITAKDNATLSGSGIFDLRITHYPTSTAGNKTITYNIDESPTELNITYNSIPNTGNIIVETNNRTPYVFKVNDFESAYSDYDNDDIASVAIFGNVTGFEFDGEAYIEGTYIDVTDIDDGLFVYHPLDQSEYYEKDVTWKAKDSEGNESRTDLPIT